MKQAFAILILVLICTASTFGQSSIQLTNLKPADFPRGVKYEGEVKNAYRWTDPSGDHLVVLTETGIRQNPKFKHENDGADAELFAYHFIVRADTAAQVWRVYDFVQDCPVDIEAAFIKNTFQVTDLNQDGFAEIWVMYKTACHGDVSPSNMKIIMYQGQQKYAMRGQNKISLPEDQSIGGEYKFDKAFNDGPAGFRRFAEKLWAKNIMGAWGE